MRDNRRQHPVGPYVLDFFCPEADLAVEVDGSIHTEPTVQHHDAYRTAWLNSTGIRVLRVTNEEIVLDVDAVVAGLIAAASGNPHPSPLPLGEGADAADDARFREVEPLPQASDAQHQTPLSPWERGRG